MNGKLKDSSRSEIEDLPSSSSPKSPTTQEGRPSSMVIKKVHTIIPPHLVAEAISTLPGVDLRWSGPITPTEMEYVQQYVLAKYPQYNHGLVDTDLSINQNNKLTSSSSSSSPSTTTQPSNKDHFSFFSPFNTNKTKLEPSRLLDIIARKSSFEGNYLSIPEVQARDRALMQCGLSEEDYLVLFMANHKDAMTMIGESYPFFKGNFYMSIISEEIDFIKEFATNKESKVIAAPESWLDLRIKGSQLSQYFRKKCKLSPKGLFAYPARVSGNNFRNSMHWISEAHRNSWHVLLDATGLGFGAGEDKIALALHQPDFVLCGLGNTAHSRPAMLTCLLVRRQSFDTNSAIYC